VPAIELRPAVIGGLCPGEAALTSASVRADGVVVLGLAVA